MQWLNNGDNMKELKLNARIQDGKIEYYDPDFRKRIEDFKVDKEGKNIDIVFQLADEGELTEMVKQEFNGTEVTNE